MTLSLILPFAAPSHGADGGIGSTNHFGSQDPWSFRMVESLRERGFTNITEADLRRNPNVWVTNFFRVHAALPLRVPDWPAPRTADTNLMAGVRGFVERYGWSMHKGKQFILAASREKVTGLPWPEIATRTFPAVTEDGVLYVVLGGFGGESVGVAWNPRTNHFHSGISGLKPLGGDWYAWKQP